MVKSLHTDAGLPFDAIDAPLVQQLLHGIKHYHGEWDWKPVQPITLSVLTALLAQLKPRANPGHMAIYTACCLIYAGLLHSGKFMAGKTGKFNSSLNLS
ncbi:hypothetical protein C0989_007441 [Termitomyces sp. Mn162]|nr:hypothetical protein C0989_007441 [Termitomyces sp. Mn162]